MQILHEQRDGPFGSELGKQGRPGVLEAVPDRERVCVAGDVEAEREAEDLASLQALDDGLGRIAFEHTEVLLQHLAERPVRDCP